MRNVIKNKSGRNILVISQYFYPENFRINDICREWVKRGYNVTVVTGIPNYPQGTFYEGYGFFTKRKEEYEGIQIIRLPIVARGKGNVRLALNYFSFVVSGYFWKIFTKIKADKVFIFEVSPMTQALVGVWYANKHNIPCSIYVQDLWPENVEIITGIHNKFIIGMINKMVNYIYKKCDKIFATSPSFVKRIEENKNAWNNGKSKVIYWPQYAEEFYKPVDKIEIFDMPKNDKLKIVFTGNIGYAQGLGILPKVSMYLKQKMVDCQFIIIGDGRYREELEKEIAQKHLSNMYVFLGRKKPEEVPYYLAWCDVAFLSFADNPLFEMTIPAKLQSYMACRMPILAIASGETKRVIEEAGCGWCYGFEDEEAIVNLVRDLDNSKEVLDILGKRALEYSNNNFDSKKLLDLFEIYWK